MFTNGKVEFRIPLVAKRGKEYQQRERAKRSREHGGGGSYDAAAIAKRRERASIMARNNRPETEAMNEDSTASVMGVLSDKSWFPWIESVVLEGDRLGDDDWEKKTDAYVFPDPALCQSGLLDQYRIQIKSGWGDFSGLASSDIKKLLDLTDREWRELGLVVLFGQAMREAIAASFCDQIINHMEIAGMQNARELFLSFQTPEMVTVMRRYEAQDIAGRDWAKLLYWVATGRTKKEEFGAGGSKVTFI